MKNCTIIRISIFSFFFSFLLYSCVDKEKQKEEKLFEEVMQIHDEVMPKTSVLMKLIKKLNVQSDDLLLEEVIDSVNLIQLKESAARLKSANDTMMDWMHQFSKPGKDVAHEEVIDYLNTQKVKITKVKELMLSAKKEGESLILE